MVRRNINDLKLKSIWDENSLKGYLLRSGANVKHANKIWTWMITHSEIQLEDVPMELWSVPKETINGIKSEYVKFTSKIVHRSDSSRGDTTKLLIELQGPGNHQVETVIMRHRGHATVCVSSQIGCQMGCKFCATGTMGIIGDLSSAEIIEQLVHANNITRIRNVVFMGMGEPLNNYDNVKLAVEFMVDTKRFGLSPRHVTVSTVGVVKNMYRMTNDMPYVNLALSLHAPNQDVRVKIVPSATAHKIHDLMAAVDNYIEHNTRPPKSTKAFTKLKSTSVMIEYILIKDINDSESCAHELGMLLSSRRAFVLLNLIPYNPTPVAEAYEAPTPEAVQRFFKVCSSDKYRIYTRVRQEMGSDIAGACGQLAVVKKQKREEVGDIEDIGGGAILRSGGGMASKGDAVRKLRDEDEKTGNDWKAFSASDVAASLTSFQTVSTLALLVLTLTAGGVVLLPFIRKYRSS